MVNTVEAAGNSSPKSKFLRSIIDGDDAGKNFPSGFIFAGLLHS
jgi:hypothetical protein